MLNVLFFNRVNSEFEFWDFKTHIYYKLKLMKNNSPLKTYKSIMKTYGIIFIAIIVCIVSVSIYVSNLGTIIEIKTSHAFIMQLTAITLTIALLPLGYISSQKIIKNINPALSLTEKLMPYRNALSLRFLSILTAAFLVNIFFLFTGNTNLIFILAIILLFYLINKPNPFKISDDLNLKEEEKQKLMPK